MPFKKKTKQKNLDVFSVIFLFHLYSNQILLMNFSHGVWVETIPHQFGYSPLCMCKYNHVRMQCYEFLLILIFPSINLLVIMVVTYCLSLSAALFWFTYCYAGTFFLKRLPRKHGGVRFLQKVVRFQYVYQISVIQVFYSSGFSYSWWIASHMSWLL